MKDKQSVIRYQEQNWETLCLQNYKTDSITLLSSGYDWKRIADGNEVTQG